MQWMNISLAKFGLDHRHKASRGCSCHSMEMCRHFLFVKDSSCGQSFSNAVIFYIISTLLFVFFMFVFLCSKTFDLWKVWSMFQLTMNLLCQWEMSVWSDILFFSACHLFGSPFLPLNKTIKKVIFTFYFKILTFSELRGISAKLRAMKSELI